MLARVCHKPRYAHPGIVDVDRGVGALAHNVGSGATVLVLTEIARHIARALQRLSQAGELQAELVVRAGGLHQTVNGVVIGLASLSVNDSLAVTADGAIFLPKSVVGEYPGIEQLLEGAYEAVVRNSVAVGVDELARFYSEKLSLLDLPRLCTHGVSYAVRLRPYEIRRSVARILVAVQLADKIPAEGVYGAEPFGIYRHSPRLGSTLGNGTRSTALTLDPVWRIPDRSRAEVSQSGGRPAKISALTGGLYILAPLGVIEVSVLGALKPSGKAVYLLAHPLGIRLDEIFIPGGHSHQLEEGYRLLGRLYIGQKSLGISGTFVEIESAHLRVVKPRHPLVEPIVEKLVMLAQSRLSLCSEDASRGEEGFLPFPRILRSQFINGACFLIHIKKPPGR